MDNEEKQLIRELTKAIIDLSHSISQTGINRNPSKYEVVIGNGWMAGAYGGGGNGGNS